jgi:hypothetical protein
MGQDCLSFNPLSASAAEIGQRWKVIDGSHWILDFGTSQENAEKAEAFIKSYGFNNICFVDRPNAPMMYFTK